MMIMGSSNFMLVCLLRWIGAGAIPVSIPKIQEGPEKTTSSKSLKLFKRNEKLYFAEKSTAHAGACAPGTNGDETASALRDRAATAASIFTARARGAEFASR